MNLEIGVGIRLDFYEICRLNYRILMKTGGKFLL